MLLGLSSGYAAIGKRPPRPNPSAPVFRFGAAATRPKTRDKSGRKEERGACRLRVAHYRWVGKDGSQASGFLGYDRVALEGARIMTPL